VVDCNLQRLIIHTQSKRILPTRNDRQVWTQKPVFLVTCAHTIDRDQLSMLTPERVRDDVLHRKMAQKKNFHFESTLLRLNDNIVGKTSI